MLEGDQFDQIERQITAYEAGEDVSFIPIVIAKNEYELEVDKFVANPEIMNSGIQVVRYLEKNSELLEGKIVTDMGTGSGIIGIASAVLGAKKVFMPDMDISAVLNSRRNTEKFGLSDTCEAFQSDLFSNYGERPKSDIQIFNHPFFADNPRDGKDWTRMMLGGTELLGRYFETAPNYSTADAKYILPWLLLAGNKDGQLDNDPGKRALEYGYRVVDIEEQEAVNQGIQQANFKVYVLEKRN